MILVLMDMFGLKIVCLFNVFGFYDVLEGYVEILFINVWVLKFNILLGEGCGFEIV